MNCYQRKTPSVQFPWRLIAGKVRWVSMATTHAVILLTVIAACAACGVLPDLRAIHVIFPEYQRSEAHALYPRFRLWLLRIDYTLPQELGSRRAFPRMGEFNAGNANIGRTQSDQSSDGRTLWRYGYWWYSSLVVGSLRWPKWRLAQAVIHSLPCVLVMAPGGQQRYCYFANIPVAFWRRPSWA